MMTGDGPTGGTMLIAAVTGSIFRNDLKLQKIFYREDGKGNDITEKACDELRRENTASK